MYSNCLWNIEGSWKITFTTCMKIVFFKEKKLVWIKRLAILDKWRNKVKLINHVLIQRHRKHYHFCLSYKSVFCFRNKFGSNHFSSNNDRWLPLIHLPWLKVKRKLIGLLNPCSFVLILMFVVWAVHHTPPYSPLLPSWIWLLKTWPGDPG